MENSTAYNRRLNLSIDISAIDKNINDNDLVYMDGRSLKIVPSDEENTNKIQKSLRKTLHTHLNNAGRQSLAKRAFENKKFITYKTFKLLISQINKPRTKQTLLKTIPQQFFTSMDSLPNLVKDDMKNKGIEKIPGNIHLLYNMATSSATGMHSLPLIKYFTTQCMGIHFDSTFETIEEEFKECSKIIFSQQNQELLLDEMACASTLNILYDICKQQNSSQWNTITLQPATQSCLKNSSDNILLDQQHESASLQTVTETDAETNPKIDAETKVDAETEVNAETKVDSEAKKLTKSTKSTKRRAKGRAKMGAKATVKSELPQTISPKKPAHAFPATPSSEPSTSGQQDTPIAEKTTEQFTSQLDKTPSKVKQIPESKPKAACLLPETILNKQTYSISSQGARPKEATYSVSSQGARPENEITSSPESITNVQNGMYINNQEKLNTLVIETCMEMRQDLAKREATVEKFIANPEDQKLFEKARKALNRRAWPAGRLHDLLVAAYSASKNKYFLTRKKFLIENKYFVSGHPPMDIKNKKYYMFSRPRDLKNARSAALHYVTINGVTPTEALDGCFRDFFIVDSGVIVELIILKTLRRFWGDRVFNRFFNAEKPLQLTSFGSLYKNTRIRSFLKPVNLECFQHTKHVKGYLYSFLNHPDYIKKDLNGEYNVIFAFCTDSETPRFCTPALFENASLPTVNEKLVELYNKEPYNEKIIDEDSWVTLRDAFYSTPEFRSFKRAIKRISVEDILRIQSNPEKKYAHKIDFEKACEIKIDYIKTIKEEEDKKEISEKHTKNYMDINKEKVAPILDSPSLLPEISKPENPSEPNKANIISMRKSNAIRLIRNYNKGSKNEVTPEEVHEAFLAFESFLLPLKDDEPQLFTEHQKSYKKIKEQVNEIRGTDTH